MHVSLLPIFEHNNLEMEEFCL